MSKAKKHLQKLGLRFEDLLNSCFTVKAGSIHREEHNPFWEQVLMEREGSRFLIACLEQLRKNTLEKKPGRITADSLCSTIVFLCLNTQFKEKRVKDEIVQYQKSKDALNKAFPPIKDMMRILTLVHEKKDMIGPMVIGCSTLHTKEGFVKLEDAVQYPAFDDEDVTSGDQCFLYRYLSLKAQDPDFRMSILSHNLNKMLTLPQQMKKAPKVAQSTLLALLHMLQDFLSKGPVDSVFLKRALNTVQQFYLWPKPYGTAAKKSLESLQNELLAPGHNMREKYLRVANQVDQGQSLHYFTHEASARTLGLLSVMVGKSFSPRSSKSTRNEPRVLLPPVQQAMLVMSAMKHEKGVGLNPQEEALFKQLSPGNAAAIYHKFDDYLTEVRESKKLSIQMAKQKRLAVFGAIKEELPKLAAAGDEGRPLPFPEDMDEVFTPPETDRQHIVVSNRLNYVHDDHASLQLIYTGSRFMPYPSTPVHDVYEEILKYYNNKNRTAKMVLPIIIGGGDGLLHNFLCAHMRVLQTDSNLLKGLDVRFYIVPFEENRLASFMARHDGWYNRHIFIPFRQHNFIVPSIDPKTINNGKLEGKDGLTLPGEFFRELIERYVGESRFRWNINVYQVECWLADRKQHGPDDDEEERADDDEEDIPDHNIPFIQSCEIGQMASAAAFRAEKKHQDPTFDKSVKEILKDRDFSHMPPPVSVAFTKMDLSGHEQKISVDMISEYETIVCSNLPSKDEKRTFPPDPTASWLELYAKVKNPSSKRNVLASEPRQHVVSLTVNVDKGGVFDVLVDGQVFTGIKKIKISRVFTVPTTAESQVGKKSKVKTKIWNSSDHFGIPKGPPLIFPVETFFPLHL